MEKNIEGYMDSGDQYGSLFGAPYHGKDPCHSVKRRPPPTPPNHRSAKLDIPAPKYLLGRVLLKENWAASNLKSMNIQAKLKNWIDIYLKCTERYQHQVLTHQNLFRTSFQSRKTTISSHLCRSKKIQSTSITIAFKVYINIFSKN